MSPDEIDRVFGRGRLKMATGEHVEVYREAVAPGERRRYTKRFLDTGECDFAQWTEREWRILARLIGHGIRCVPDVVQFDGGGGGRVRLVQTYDAGVTVDQWATLLPVARNGRVLRHVFEDCAHWWALAHHCLGALDEIHRISLVHLDIKGDNLCIPFGPPNFDPNAADARLYPIFPRLALIDFAFSLVSHESLAAPLPLGWQKDYDYQSPRLLAALEAGRAGNIEPTMDLDWRCDLYSLAAMLKRYLPDETRAHAADDAFGWTPLRYAEAKALIFRIRDAHDRDFPHWRPHQELMELSAAKLREPGLAASLDYGWTLAHDASGATGASPITPMTRIAPSLHATRVSPLVTEVVPPTAITAIAVPVRATGPKRTRRHAYAIAATLVAVAAIAAPTFIDAPWRPIADDLRAVVDRLRAPSPPVVAQSRDADTAAKDALPTAGDASSLNPDAAKSAPTTAEAPAPTSAPPSGSHAPAPTEPVSHATAAAAAPAATDAHAATTATGSPTTSAADSAHAKAARGSGSSPRYPLAHATPANASSRQAHARNAPEPAPTTKPPPSRRDRGETQVASTRAPVHVARTASPSASSVPPSIAAYVASLPKASPNVAASSQATTDSRTTPAPAAEASSATHAPASSPSTTAVAAIPEGDETTAPANPVTAHAPDAGAAPLRPIAPPRRDNDLRSRLSALWRTLRGRDQPAAPVEERIAQAAPRSAPAAVAPVVRAPQVAMVSPLIAQLGAPVAPSMPRAAESPPVAPDYATQARRMLVESLPGAAARAQADVSRVLWVATNASLPSQESGVLDAARAAWPSEGARIAPTLSSAYARQMQDSARHAFASGAGIDRALDAQLRAFGADPHDPDVASFLAYLHLRANPAQPEPARELALYALALRGPARSSRVDDWQTFAIASALAGRNHDARMALYASLALGGNLDRTCRSALAAYANYGERMRAPVEAMLYRVHVQGRERESPYCAWPPDWTLVSRAQ